MQIPLDSVAIWPHQEFSSLQVQRDLINRKPVDGPLAELLGPSVKDIPNLLYDLDNMLIDDFVPQFLHNSRCPMLGT